MAQGLPDTFVLLDGSFGGANGHSGFYSEPIRIIRACEAEEVPAALAAIDQAQAEGNHVAGFIAYELGYALEARLAPLMPPGRSVPLIWMGVFRAPSSARGLPRGPVRPPGEFTPSIGPDAYRKGIERILEYIRAGDVYQVNYTLALTFERPNEPLALYQALKRNQPVAYPSALQFDGNTILSLSPELFFRIENGVITTRPMKGTAPRARSLVEDRAAGEALKHDVKNRAENLMIVDLMRNDLSRISKVGTVRVPQLFTLETYRTLHTLTSTVEAELKANTRPSDVIRALFPCGSVTGAPKIRAMEVIRELERSPRGVYTGAIGVFRPGGSACFNVAIRTLSIPARGPATIGVGGGIVADSDAASEAAETRLKARFLSGLPLLAADQAPLKLIETLRWEPRAGFAHLDYHLRRLTDSAVYFGMPLDSARAQRTLLERAADYTVPMRVRLTLNEFGVIEISEVPLGADPRHWRYTVSEHRIRSDDPYRAHKTTRRALYDQEYARLSKQGCDEVLFLNERGELAEGSRSNVFIEHDGKLLTPPVSSGALPGTLRAELLASGQAKEAVLVPEDLDEAGAVYFGNSVRGLKRAEMVRSFAKPGASAMNAI
ncbi:MAG: aminodeoxychorismate synthase component I [Alphaproteobacteria bacterium]